jgi:hypothetical protein
MVTRKHTAATPAAPATEENNPEFRRTAEFEHYGAMKRDLDVARAIVDAIQAITDPNNPTAVGQFSDHTLGVLLAHCRSVLETAEIEAEEVHNCFVLERMAAEVAHG